MAATTIEWTSTVGTDSIVHGGYSFNAWLGCQEISVGPKGACERCYARAWAKRTGQGELWEGERRRTTADYWKQPLKWNSRAERLGVSLKVFCCSLADVFDNTVPAEWRRDLFALINQTPNLTWMLLTKRIGNAWDMIDEATEGYPPWRLAPWRNVWIGSTVVTQAEVDRDVPKLLRTPAAVRFLSCEPLMEEIDFSGRFVDHKVLSHHETWLEALDLVIAGGESGGRARSCNVDWLRSLQQQCSAVGTSFFMKQLGGVRDKRGNVEDLPEDLRIREFPTTERA
jgi:protein gp37